MPDKVTISHRGARYEIGRGKRYYGIWVAGAPDSAPIDRWPETREGWAQAWTRFVTIETPGTIGAVEQPRSGFRFPGLRLSGERSAKAGPSGTRLAITAAALLALGVVIGVAGLFPDYFTGQSLVSQADELLPHLLYLAGWAVSAVLVLRGGGKSRVGALLGIGLSAVTFGLFLSDLGQVFSGGSHLEAGIVISVAGWAVCTAGAGTALAIRPAAGASAADSAGAPDSHDTLAMGGQDDHDTIAMGESASAGIAGAPVMAAATARRGGPVRPTARHAGPIALLVLGAIGTVAAFAPSWDSYTISSATTAQTQTITAGNAFTQPGWVIAGDVAVMVAVVAIAALAALWHPARQGAAFLAGAIIPMVAQAISAVIQIGQPTSPGQLGISQSQASSLGLTISNGLTPIFWVYCVFVIALLISCAWLITDPMRPAAAASAQPAWGGPIGGPIGEPIPPVTDDDGENTGENTGGGEVSDDGITGSAHGEAGAENADSDGGAEDGGEDDEENTYA